MNLLDKIHKEICQKTVTQLTHDFIYAPTSLGKCFFVNLTEMVSNDDTLKAPGN